jgi:alpha-ketoglutarate-dependent taurine dioxygenase
MAYQTIAVNKLTPRIGAEIAGVDLSRPLGNQQFQEVHDALMENLVIFFRDQHLTHEQRSRNVSAISPAIPRRAMDPRGTRKSAPCTPTKTQRT